MVAKRALFDSVGPFDESLRRLEDWEWLLRCAQITPIAVVPEILALVNSGTHEVYTWEHVRDSATLIAHYALAGKYGLGDREIRILRSTLHGEMAASAFRRRHYGSATVSFLVSLYCYPFKRASYYRRIARAIKGDVLRSISRSQDARNGVAEADQTNKTEVSPGHDM